MTSAAKKSAHPSSSVTYVDDVFSTYLYTGNGSSQTINNGIDLAGKGGMVWVKARTNSSGVSSFGNNQLSDTALGLTNSLCSNDTSVYTDNPPTVSSVSATGFVTTSNARIAYNGNTYASWTFRKAAKFFDVVTYTGTGSARTIAHSLGSAPGCIIVKRTDTTGNWQVYHNGLTSAAYSIQLNLTSAQASATTVWNSTAPTSSVFSVGTDATVNASGGTYVAYLFAHDTSSAGLIQCGSFTTTVSTDVAITLGWEPQFVLWKRASSTGNWNIDDSMRGMSYSRWGKLFPNTTAAEANDTAYMSKPTPTGFIADQSYGLGSGETIIYIAIRRPNKPPTSGTQVYNAIARTGTGANATIAGVGFPTDLLISQVRSVGSYNGATAWDRLRGSGYQLSTAYTNAESYWSDTLTSFASMDGYSVGASVSDNVINTSGKTWINWSFKRAPGFMDVVAYKGNGSLNVINHSLGVPPELLIIKSRGNSSSWDTYCQYAPSPTTKFLRLEGVSAPANVGLTWISSIGNLSFALGAWDDPNNTLYNYIAYLFATLPGISKVGSYTGNGSSQTINCGFAAGARFILIKRTDSTGDWYVWDSARGIVAANDPHLSLNTTAAEVTTDDSVDIDSSGFIVNQVAATNINVTSATYIFLSVA